MYLLFLFFTHMNWLGYTDSVYSTSFRNINCVSFQTSGRSFGLVLSRVRSGFNIVGTVPQCSSRSWRRFLFSLFLRFPSFSNKKVKKSDVSGSEFIHHWCGGSASSWCRSGFGSGSEFHFDAAPDPDPDIFPSFTHFGNQEKNIDFYSQQCQFN